MVAVLSDLVDAYHRELTGHPGEIQEWAAKLETELRQRRLVFGDRVLCSFLRPHFIGESQWDRVREASRILSGAFQKVFRAVLEDPSLLSDLGLTEGERRLLSYSKSTDYPCYTSRLDGFVSGETLQFVEFNAECPAGIGYSDRLQEVFLEFPPLKALNERGRIKPLYSRQNMLGALLSAWEQSGRTGTPRMAIVDWRDVPTRFEFEIFQEYFSNQGFPCLVIDPRELEYQNGKLCRGSYQIDLVYRRLLTNELLQAWDETRKLVEAYRENAVVLLNPFSAKILHKKALFALLTDERHLSWFSPAEVEAIQRHIPWTRWVREGKTAYRGNRVDLVPFLEKNRENFVLKPNDEYGGKGIYVGWDGEARRWRDGLEKALTFGDTLVQERVAVGRAEFPYWDEGLKFGEFLVDLDPFLFSEGASGFLTRLSGTHLCNVTSGGGSVPTFVVEGL